MRQIAAIAIAGLVLAACGQGSPSSVNVSQSNSREGIFVSGSGEVTGTPDTLTVNLGVTVREETVSAATATAAERANAVIEALTSNGVAEEDITTTNYSVFPEYDFRGEQERLLGYRVTNTVSAKIRDIDAAGDVIDEAVEAAGDEAVVQGLSFSLEDNADLVEAARAAAWEDARSKAEQLAELSGKTLGEVTSIRETISNQPVPVFFDEARDGAEAATPIQPGTSAVTIQLEVEFALD